MQNIAKNFSVGDTMEKPLIIFDTDMDTDCDDAGALGLLLKYVKNNKVDFLGIIADTPTEYAAPCCEAICNWYGIEVPIGAVSTEKYKADPRFESYRKHRAGISEEKYYNAILSKRVGKTDKDYTPAATLYRKLLANAPDNGVTVVCVGLFTAVYELFKTQGDEISPLSGTELFAKKVKCVVSMGNADYPEQEKFNFNYKMDKVSSIEFFKKCPVSVYISKMGTDIITGKYFSAKLPNEHPLRIAYESFMGGEGIGRQSWDLIALLYAIKPNSGNFETKTYGTVKFNGNKTYWKQDCERQDFVINLTLSDKEITSALEYLLNGV